jgi:hypothetical protein
VPTTCGRATSASRKISKRRSSPPALKSLIVERFFAGAETNVNEPDPRGRIGYDDGQFVKVETAVVPGKTLGKRFDRNPGETLEAS